jgi:hypothetical protein
MVSDRQRTIIENLLRAVDDHLPVTVAEGGSAANPLGVAAVRHAANLLSGELVLAEADLWSLTRLLGRAIVEAWLWANLLFLVGDDAVTRLLAEAADHDRRLEAGRRDIWERLESKRPGGIDLRNATLSSLPEPPTPSQIEDLARKVRAARDARGLGGGLAEINYQLGYRWDTVNDVHVGLDVLARYRRDRAEILRVPSPDEDITPFRGPESLHHDTKMVADALGIYLTVTDQTSALDEAKKSLADIV